MKLFRETLIILGIYLIGEVLSSLLHLPISGNILGMIILFILLCTKIVRVENISNVTDFLLNHLSFFFIPAGVGLMTAIDIVKSTWWQILLVCLITTSIIIGTTGTIVQVISKRTKPKKINLFIRNEGEIRGCINE